MPKRRNNKRKQKRKGGKKRGGGQSKAPRGAVEEAIGYLLDPEGKGKGEA